VYQNRYSGHVTGLLGSLVDSVARSKNSAAVKAGIFVYQSGCQDLKIDFHITKNLCSRQTKD
jgi:hypothetical protein